MRVQEFDGVFDGDDMLMMLGVDLVDHGGQRGRFPGTGRSGDEDEPLRLLTEIGDDLRETQLFEWMNGIRDSPNRHPHGSSLNIDISAEPAQILDSEGAGIDGVVACGCHRVRVAGSGELSSSKAEVNDIGL